MTQEPAVVGVNANRGTEEYSDTALVRAFLAGDEAAFSHFVQRHGTGLYRVARLWLQRPDSAADVVQECFLRSYTGFRRFRFQAQPKTWLYRMCRNVCREVNRTTARETLTDAAEQFVERQQEAGVGEQDPAALFATTREQTMLHELIAQLPVRQREVVVLRILEDLSVAETARVMTCREGTVKAHLAKALRNLRAIVTLQKPEQG